MARVLYSGVNEYGQPSEVMLGCAIGDIIPHFGSTPPPGTLVCDGSEISRETYHELYEEIGALCGPGDGSTTFELPDLRDVWLVWAGTQHGAGANVSEGLPNISGAFGPTNLISMENFPSEDINEDGTFDRNNGVFSWRGQATGNISKDNTSQRVQFNWLHFSASGSSAIYGASQHVTPASVAVLPCIVYE